MCSESYCVSFCLSFLHAVLTSNTNSFRAENVFSLRVMMCKASEKSHYANKHCTSASLAALLETLLTDAALFE